MSENEQPVPDNGPDTRRDGGGGDKVDAPSGSPSFEDVVAGISFDDADEAPRTGYKRGFIVEVAQRGGGGTRLVFAPITWVTGGATTMYLGSDTARCLRPDHPVGEPVPAEGCTCGFYVVQHQEMLGTRLGKREPSAVRLDVELTGTIIECVNDKNWYGWRGSHQDVLGAHVNAQCWLCSQPTSVLGINKRDRDKVARPLCVKHGRRATKTWTIAQAASDLGCEVASDQTGDTFDTKPMKAGKVLVAVAPLLVAILIAGVAALAGFAGVAVAVALCAIVITMTTGARWAIYQTGHRRAQTPVVALLFAGVLASSVFMMVTFTALVAGEIKRPASVGSEQKVVQKDVMKAVKAADAGPPVDVNQYAWQLAASLGEDGSYNDVYVAQADPASNHVRLSLTSGARGITVQNCWQADVTRPAGGQPGTGGPSAGAGVTVTKLAVDTTYYTDTMIGGISGKACLEKAQKNKKGGGPDISSTTAATAVPGR